jgi:hypothetical protein
MRLGDGRGVARVRHVLPGPDANQSVYGVHFVETDASFEQAVFDLVAAHRGNDMVWRWDHGD